MTTDTSQVAIAYVLLAVLVVAAGCSGLGGSDPTSVSESQPPTTDSETRGSVGTTSTDEAEPAGTVTRRTVTVTNTTTDTISYAVDYRCQDHDSAGGGTVHECWADITVRSVGNASVIEIRAVDDHSYETKLWTVPRANTTGDGEVWVESDGAAELQYGDVVIIAAIYPDRRVELEHHRFDCNDVYYTDAC